MAMNRNVLAAIVATVVMTAVVILGFRVMGSPGNQRRMQSDLRTVQSLAGLAQQINMQWANEGKVLPKDLEKFPSSVKQVPPGSASVSYRVKSSSEYELCATFARDNRNDPAVNTGDPWIHPKGDYCFQFDALRPVSAVPYYY
jgi:hypothetical protein